MFPLFGDVLLTLLFAYQVAPHYPTSFCTLSNYKKFISSGFWQILMCIKFSYIC